MALWNILAGASGGLRQGLDDLRQRQLQDEQRQRQVAMDQMQREQFDLQKQQMADNQAQRSLENQRWQTQWDAQTQRNNAAARVQGIELARSGVLSDKNALNQYYRDAGLPVEQATMQLSPLMQALTGINRDQLSTDRDYAAGQYGAVRSQQLADVAAQREVEAKRIADERAFQVQRQQAQQAFQERLAQLQGRLSLQTAQAQRDFAPSFSTVTGQDGKVYSFNQRSGQINPLGIHAQDKGQKMSPLDIEQKISDILKNDFPYGVMPSQQAVYNARREQLRAMARNGQLPETPAASGPINPSTGQPYGPMAQILLQNLPGAKGAK